MQLSDISVLVRDKSLAIQGMIPDQDLDLQASIDHNGVGSWKLNLSAVHPMAPVLRTPGSGLIVVGPDGENLFSGPTDKPELSISADDPSGTVTFQGVTDNVILGESLAFPSPALPTSGQTEANDTRTGPSETLMHAYVNANIGPTATTGRRNTNLVMGANAGRGTVVTKAPRFQVLGELLAELAIEANYPLGFRVVQRGGSLAFETYQIRDRSAEIRLDALNNTLASQKVSQSPPAITVAIVAGQGVGKDRQIREYHTAEADAAGALWGRRIERFIDQRQTSVEAELEAAGMEPLQKEGVTTLAVQATPAEDSSMNFLTDWYLGDRVTVVVEGQELVADVTGFVFKVDKDGFRLGAVIGDPAGFSAEAAVSNRVANTEKRVSSLERNDAPGSTGGGSTPSADKAALKTSDTTATNTTTLATDAALSITGIASGNYIFDAMIVYSADSEADFKAAFLGSAGIANLIHLNLREVATGAEHGVVEGGAAFTAAGQGAGTKRSMQLTGSFTNSSSSQSLSFQWAQRTAHASTVAVHRGSFVRIQKV
ncbi:siphovirus ReqiPepy6 Gp37-like family protein [Kribbella sindirgiensis]|uniref:Gp28/Gp37-like domain-containing protein n=1 Tax=Kribbella sindirgiensis TaxID=1124744 RepID=A0A4R0I269_9ACTN|nr:siphovirus ReqiPepy6 Gp37-like family protein [Kribbella sindirgiensis]TCC19966.1 hypothetical protein E0H50_37715 [Kribbella sindirgiensis]